jgi:hypothetical protein
VQQIEALSRELNGHNRDAGDVSPRPVEGGDKARLNRVEALVEDDRDGRCRRLGSKGHWSRSDGDNHVHLATNQIVRQGRQPIVLQLCPAVFDHDILALGKACFA